MDLDDSFARMRNRVLQRNAHIMKLDSDFDSEPVFKKPNILTQTAEPENKENIIRSTDSLDSIKPKIAEHLTIRKSPSTENMDYDEQEVFIMRNPKKIILSEENYNSEKREDVYVKHCKSRLANLAGKFKQFEEEDNHVPVRPLSANNKNIPTKRRLNEFELTKGAVSSNKNIKCEALVKKEFKSPADVSMRSDPKKDNESSIYTKTDAKIQKTPEKAILDQSVVKTLESQGYTRTVSDAHLFYDFKTAKSKFDKQEKNVFIPNAQKIQESEDNSSIDPCFLSVAERRKLFEKKLASAATESAAVEFKSSPKTEYLSPDVSESNSEVDEDLNISEYSSSYEDNSDSFEREVLPATSAVIEPADMEFVKFVSTPKPGRLYPSLPDLDNKDEDLNITRYNNSYKDDNDNSFGREVLIATNSIYSSFQNTGKDESALNNISKKNALSEVKDLITPDKTSLSLSSVAQSSANSVEYANETASFTFQKTYANSSIDISPIPISYKSHVKQPEQKCDAKTEPYTDEKKNEDTDEFDVKYKIQFLEEQVVKEKIKLTQTIRALKLCLSTSFLNSVSHLEAEKLVLLSQLRITAAQNEIDRIKVENSIQSCSKSANSIQGNVVISKIKLPVKMSVVHADLKENIYNNLMCVIKCGETVLTTEVISVTPKNIKHDPECTYVEFPDTVTVSDVCSDFKISIEVYNLVVETKDNANVKQSHAVKKDKKTPNSKKDKKTKNFPSCYIEDKKKLHSSFVMVGYMIFSHNEVQRHQWILNKCDLYHTPLVGMLLMQLQCNLTKIMVQKHGFLTIYEMISGYGAWCRYWFYLNGSKFSYWKYPEQESTQEPIGSFDLTKCTTTKVVVVGYDVVFRPQTFILQFYPDTYLLQFKGLTENRLLLSADNEEDRINWCDCLNQVLQCVRSWNPA